MPKKRKKKEIKPPTYYEAKMIWGGGYDDSGVARVRIPENSDPAKKDKALQDMKNLAKLNSSNKYPFY